MHMPANARTNGTASLTNNATIDNVSSQTRRLFCSGLLVIRGVNRRKCPFAETLD